MDDRKANERVSTAEVTSEHRENINKKSVSRSVRLLSAELTLSRYDNCALHALVTFTLCPVPPGGVLRHVEGKLLNCELR